MSRSYSEFNTSAGQMYMPNIIQPLDIPKNIFTMETVRAIQNNVATSLKRENIPPNSNDVIVPETDVVKQEMVAYARLLYPYFDQEKLIRYVSRGIIDDFVEKYYDIHIVNTQTTSSVTETNPDRIRKRMPKKPRAYVDIS